MANTQSTISIGQTRIFVPNAAPFAEENWYETLLGKIISPLTSGTPTLDWWWCLKYDEPVGQSDGDCDITAIPNTFRLQDGNYRSVRLRFAIPVADQADFENRGNALITGAACAVSDWRPYDLVKDLGGDRFVGEDRDTARRQERAESITLLLHHLSAVVLHSLIRDGNGFRFERNDNVENPNGSSFESLHHLFCNITSVPTFVSLLLGAQTEWMPSPVLGAIGKLRVTY